MIALVEKYKPQLLEEFIGLGKVKRLMRSLIKDPYGSAWLLLGPAGQGKTTLAFAVAKAIGGQVHHVPANGCSVDVLDKLVYDCHFTPFFGGSWHIVIIDEANAMSPAAQKSMLSILDGTRTPPSTIWLLTANSKTSLEQEGGGRDGRLISRMRLVEFHEPTSAELAEFLERVWRLETKSDPPPEMAANIAIDAKGNIRQALMNMEMELMAAGDETPAVVKPVAKPKPVWRDDVAVEPAEPKSPPPPAGRAVELRRAGLSLKQIASELDAPQSSVWRWTQGVKVA